MTVKRAADRRYPMPCPGCRKMIDARDRLCPYCGIDTDAKLALLRAVLPFVVVALLIVVAALFRSGPFAYALLIGVVIGAGVTLWAAKRRGRRSRS